MNPSPLSRKVQVLLALQDAGGAWVDGPVLANERTGGSEGLKRLRELRDEDGWAIEGRRHPDPDRDVWQYRLDPAAFRNRPAPDASIAQPSPVLSHPAASGTPVRVHNEPVIAADVRGFALLDVAPEPPPRKRVQYDEKAQPPEFGDLQLIRSMRVRSRKR